MRECEQKIINNYEIDCKLTSFDCWTFIALLRDFNDFSFSDFIFIQPFSENHGIKLFIKNL